MQHAIPYPSLKGDKEAKAMLPTLFRVATSVRNY